MIINSMLFEAIKKWRLLTGQFLLVDDDNASEGIVYMAHRIAIRPKCYSTGSAPTHINSIVLRKRILQTQNA